MHIHIAHFESKRSLPDVPQANYLVWRLAAATNVSTDPSAPTRLLGEGFYNAFKFQRTPLGRPPKDWARAYAVHVPTTNPVQDLGVSVGKFRVAWLCFCWDARTA